MIILLAASSLYVSALQAGIAAPTSAFRGCLREAATKAKTDKIPGEGIEAYLKNACSAQMGTLREALIGFRIKNGMSHSAAAADAAMTVNDYVSTPADNYKFMAAQDTKQTVAAPAAPKAAPAGAQAALTLPAKATLTPASQAQKP